MKMDVLEGEVTSSYSVRLEVTDSEGATGSTEMDVSVYILF